jgi:hypothetical protein
MDVENLAKELILKNMTPEQQMAVLDSVRQSVAQAKEVQKRKIGENVDLVVQALKKIESDIRSRYDDIGNAIEKRVASIKDGRDGINGKDGRDGKDGKSGRDGAKGDKGDAGRDGRDGVDGVDGVSVTSARIDFDGSLVITLSSGVELNVGEVVAPDLAERIKVITNGGGTSQSVLDTLDSLQTQINTLIPSQTGNSGKFLTTNGTSTSWASVAGGLSYQGTWNASTNSPTLTSSVGTNGYYYIVATAGSTNLNGITDWQIGDWLMFNGSVWQKIDQSDTLQSITSTDGSVTVTTTGSTADLSVAVSASTTNVICLVRNTTGATLTKGTAVYISGATGQNPTVSKAQANSDATSAQTLGLMTADLANNSNGYVTVIGLITNIDTSAYTDGAQLYLSGSTAGALTATKPYAPTHLVYVAVVEHAHATQGKLFVKVQNGYEMDELHNVSAQSPSNGQTLIYNTSTSLWEKANLTAGTGISVSNGAGSITISNTGVTSVTGTSPVASSGGATPAISLAASYGDTQNPYASKTANYVLAAPNGTAGVPTFRAIVAADIPTLNQNTTGTASNVTGTVAIANGGSGQTTAQLAMNAFAGAVTSGSYLRGNGTNVVMNTIQAADVPTLNQNTTGSAATVTTTINSGVVATTQTAGDNSTKVATTAYVNAITGTVGINGFKNRIINGAMVIDQRNAGASVSGTTGVYTLDRWKVQNNSGSARFNVQQNVGSVTPPAGYKYYLGITSTSAYSVAATDIIAIQQFIEGYNIADLAWGTASAVTVTLSFWVRSSLTGTFGGSVVEGAAGGALYPFSYTISAANTWEQKTVTIVGSTIGTWNSTNGAGIQLLFSMGTGSTYSGTAGSWTASAYYAPTGATSIVGTNGATFYITGVQLEKGSTATSFDYRPYGTELALCQRYYYPVRGSGQFADVVGTTTTDMFFATPFPVEMRATPTMTGVLTALVVSNFSTAYTASGGSYSFNGTSTQGVNVRKSGFTSLSTTYRYFLQSTSIVVTADAEL